MTPAVTAVALAAGTLVSEDLATIGAAALASLGHIGFVPALLAVGAGIYAGDLGLFLVGRLGRSMPLVRRLIRRHWPADDLVRLADRFDRRLPLAIVASRFLPGSRLPLYVAAGLFSARPGSFCGWTLLAVALWTPVLFGGSVWLGSVFADGARTYVAWTPMAGLALGLIAVPRLLAASADAARSRDGSA